MNKASKIKSLIDCRTELLEAVAGLEDSDFDVCFGDQGLSLKTRLSHVAAGDWEMARCLRAAAQGQALDTEQIGTPDILSKMRCDPAELRNCSSIAGSACANDVVSEVVLSLQCLLDELRSLDDRHFADLPAGPDDQDVPVAGLPGISPSVPADLAAMVATTIAFTLSLTEQHFEETRTWLRRTG